MRTRTSLRSLMTSGELVEGMAESVLVFPFVSVSWTSTGNSFAGATSFRLKSHFIKSDVGLCIHVSCHRVVCQRPVVGRVGNAGLKGTHNQQHPILVFGASSYRLTVARKIYQKHHSNHRVRRKSQAVRFTQPHKEPPTM